MALSCPLGHCPRCLRCCGGRYRADHSRPGWDRRRGRCHAGPARSGIVRVHRQLGWLPGRRRALVPVRVHHVHCRRIRQWRDHSMADIALHGRDPNWAAAIIVMPSGGPGSVLYQGPLFNFFNLSPDVGDQLAISIFYDRHGHDYYTATDIAPRAPARRSAPISAAPSTPTAWLRGSPLDPPPADIRLWHFTGSHITTYTGAHGTILGPWTTSKLIATIDGTASAEVLMSPSSLGNGGQNF